ncbi:MAG: hypothetical protein JST40_03845 [Armatimonadetes bacterium]|nr:hypothetical protein [Armatimonadota bacterium]
MYEKIKLLIGAVATIGLYSVLYRENKFYRFVEHMFLGLAAGYTLVAVWKETLKVQWWDRMVGTAGDAGSPGTPGFWAFMFLLPIGMMGYMVFNKKHNWMSRIPIGIILGFWSGQQVQIFWSKWGGQLFNSMKPLIPTGGAFVPSTDGLTPEQMAEVGRTVYVSQAVNNIIFTVTILSVLSYFFFSFELKNKFMLGMNKTGRWLLMIGLGAIFGSTVMARFALEIDRMSFIFVELVKALRT